MPHNLTSEQRALLNSDRIKARVLTTWYMDDGEYRYCDDSADLTIEGETFVGASALAACSEIKSGNSMSAEPVTLTLDGTRLYQAGFEDPADLFRIILALPLSNRVVRVELALGHQDQDGWLFKLPMFSGKINSVKVEDPGQDLERDEPVQSKLVITLDALSLRYGWTSYRVRTHQDQLEIDPEDMFFSFVHENQRNESTLYWGKKPATVRPQWITGAGGYFSDLQNNINNGYFNK